MNHRDGRHQLSDLRTDLVRGKRHYASPTARILEAAIAIADADTDDEEAWHRGWVRLRKTLIETGWTPPARDSAPGVAD